MVFSETSHGDFTDEELIEWSKDLARDFLIEHQVDAQDFTSTIIIGDGNGDHREYDRVIKDPLA